MPQAENKQGPVNKAQHFELTIKATRTKENNRVQIASSVKSVIWWTIQCSNYFYYS